MNLSVSVILTRIITLCIAFTVHEFFHAWTANRFGDSTARRAGRLTLNPIKHIDPFGALMVIIVGFGWAKPVPVNPTALRVRNKMGLMWVSLAGPLSNFFLALIGGILIASGLIHSQSGWRSSELFPSPFYFLVQFILINLNLMVFNLLPLAPLDGEKVLEPFIPSAFRLVWDKIQQYGTFILMALFFILPYIGIDLFSIVLSPIVRNLFIFVTGG